MGWSTSQKQVQNPLNPLETFFCRLGNFFCRLGDFFGFDQFLPSNELSDLTYGAVNFPKTGAKSSKPFGNFFCRLGNFFCRIRNFFGSFYSNAGQKSAEGRFFSKLVYKFCPSQNLVHLSRHRGGGQLPKNRCEIL